jgi:hypothetical protein
VRRADVAYWPISDLPKRLSIGRSWERSRHQSAIALWHVGMFRYDGVDSLFIPTSPGCAQGVVSQMGHPGVDESYRLPCRGGMSAARECPLSRRLASLAADLSHKGRGEGALGEKLSAELGKRRVRITFPSWPSSDLIRGLARPFMPSARHPMLEGERRGWPRRARP